jgi:O-antigen/teichoic acid export membrane protein
LVLGQQFARVLSVFLLPFLTPYLTSYDFGVWGLVLTYTGLLSGIKDFGLTQLVVNVFFQRKKNYQTIWRLYYGWLLLWSIAFVLIQALVLWVALYYLSHGQKFLIIGIFSFLSFAVDPYVLFIFRFNQLSNKFSAIAFNSLLSGIASIVVVYYLVVKLRMGYMGWVWSFFAAQSLSFIHYWFAALKSKLKMAPIFAYRPHLFRNAMKVGMPTIPHNYSAYILNASDRMVMDWVKVPIDRIGLYSLGYNIGMVADSIGSAVTMILSALYLKLFSEKKVEVIKKVTFSLQFVFLFVSVLVCIWIKELFPILIKNLTLLEAYKVTFVIILSYAFRPLYVVPVNILGFAGHTNALWKITFSGAVINIALNLMLVPIYGYFVAAITTFFSLLFIGVAGYFLKPFKEICKEDFKIVLWTLFIVGLSTGAYFVLEAPLWIKAVTTLLLLVFLAVQTRKLNMLIRKYKLL